MGIILRVDVEKAYGNHTFMRKVPSKVNENYYPTSPIFYGYLDHLKIFLNDINQYNIEATCYHRLSNLSMPDLVQYYEAKGHQLGLHFENSRSLEMVKEKLITLKKKYNLK